MQMVALQASTRTAADNVKTLRSQGRIPGVVYGNIENTMLHFDEVTLKKAFVKAGESTLVELDADGKKVPVLFHAIDQDPVSDRMIHVDFYAVDMNKEVEADVHIRFEGEAPAVKEAGAILVTAMHDVTVRALPAKLPHDLAVSLEKLTEFGATLTVADIVVPDGVEILNDKDDVIAVAQEPREEAVEEPTVAEGAEGAPAADGTAAPADGAAPAAAKEE